MDIAILLERESWLTEGENRDNEGTGKGWRAGLERLRSEVFARQQSSMERHNMSAVHECTFTDIAILLERESWLTNNVKTTTPH